MVSKDCIAKVAQAMERDLTPEEVDFLANQLQPSTQRPTTPADLMRRKVEIAEHLVRMAQLKKFHAYRNVLVMEDLMSGIKNWQGDLRHAVDARLAGTVKAGEQGARDSVHARQQYWAGRLLGGFDADLRKAGVTGAFGSRAIQQDVARASFDLSAGRSIAGYARDVREIAQIWHKWSEYSRRLANGLGANIGKAEDYIVSVSHDMLKVRRAEFLPWAKDIWDKLDWHKIELDHGVFRDNDERLGWLQANYENISSGDHMVYSHRPLSEEAYKPNASLANRMSRKRILYFKDADSWFAYNEKYGMRSVTESMEAGLRHRAANIGLMETFGPNPNDMFARWKRSILEYSKKNRSSEDHEALRNALSDTDGTLTRTYKAINGEMNIPVNRWWATFMLGVRQIEQMARLGMIFFATLGDTIPAGLARSRLGGSPFAETAKQALDLLKGRPKIEIEEALAEMGLYQKSLISGLAGDNQMDFHGHPMLTRASNAFFRYTGSNYLTDVGRMSVGLEVARKLAKLGETPFDKLTAQAKQQLGLYKINASDWAQVRTLDVDGHKIFDIMAMSPKTREKFQNLLVDYAYSGVLEPDPATRSHLLFGTRAGTVSGETMRAVTLFKSYPASFIRQALSRELHQSSSRGIAAWRLGSALVASLGVGMAISSLRDIASGRKPQMPWDEDTDKVRLWSRWMLAGGGLAIYGDFLLHEYKYGGADPVDILAGPIIGDAGRLLVAALHSLNTDRWEEDPEAAALEVWRATNRLIPFRNFILTKWATDPFLFNQIQEAIAPGSVAASARRSREQYGTEYWLEPDTSLPEFIEDMQ